MATRRQKKGMFDLFLDFVAANPKMSAAVAFQIGALAAQAANGAPRAFREYRRHGLAAASNRVMQSLPDVGPMSELKALMGPTRPARRKRKSARAKARASASQRKAAAS
jgi:hypothetical protein